MKIDDQYLKRLLYAFQDSHYARPKLSEILHAMGLDDLDERFLFHYEILFDYGFLESTETKDLFDAKGIVHMTENKTTWTDISLRLTAKGHEYVESLRMEGMKRI